MLWLYQLPFRLNRAAKLFFAASPARLSTARSADKARPSALPLVCGPVARGHWRLAAGPSECRRRSLIFRLPSVNHGPGLVAGLFPLVKFCLQCRRDIRRSDDDLHVGAIRQGCVILGHHETVFDDPWDDHTFGIHVVHLRSSGPLVLLGDFLDKLVVMANRPGSNAPPHVDAPEVGIGVFVVVLVATSAAVGGLVPRPYGDSHG